MNLFKIKKILAFIYGFAGISNLKLFLLNKKNKNYVRVVNYHETENLDSFARQIKWYRKHFNIISYDDLRTFLKGEVSYKDKPGILMTFDDGKKSNYYITKNYMNSNHIKGLFFISPDLIGTDGYMTWNDVGELLKDGHSIGCHTSTHHRMNNNDSKGVLEYEIKASKKKIEDNCGILIDSFCWCGGEEQHYTKFAAQMIEEANYKYSFLTNSSIVQPKTNHLLIERTNIECNWSISLVKFQLCGFIDKRYQKKKERVEALLSR